MTFQEFDQWLVDQARTMPRAMNKGGTDAARANMTTANADNSSLFTQGQTTENQLLPFLNQEVTNPQGFGATGVNQLETAGGEATSGAVGGANEAANLRASRMGNPSSTASIIDAAARTGAQQQSTNALDVNKANLQAKLAQQQAGSSGEGQLAEGNIGESLSALGLSNQAVSDYITAANNTSVFSDIGKLFGGGGGGAVGGAMGDASNAAFALGV